jgi:aminopeptidase
MEERYSAYADLALDVGLNLQSGQRLWLSMPIIAAPLARVIATAAYRRGARYVEMNWTDDEMTLARFEHAPRDSFTEVSVWRSEAMLAGAKEGDAFLSVRASDPQLFEGAGSGAGDDDAAYGSRAQQGVSDLRDGAQGELVCPGGADPGVGAPDLPRGVRRGGDDPPVGCHRRRLPVGPAGSRGRLEHTSDPAGKTGQPAHGRRLHLSGFAGPGTDLTVGLVRNHRWIGGQSTTESGITFTPNVPTEEVFCLPHKDRVDGTVKASKPLNYGGTLIEGLQVRFEKGRAVEVTADAGQAVMRGLIDTDDGSARLGEVALVPASSPISTSGLLFYNTLFDENAASHIAVGRAYSECLQGGGDMTREELAARGVNDRWTS